MGIFAWIILGLIVGLVAKWIVPGKTPFGILGDIVIGIVGAFIGGFIYHLFGHVGITGFNWHTIIAALIGAVVLLWILRALSGRNATAA